MALAKSKSKVLSPMVQPVLSHQFKLNISFCFEVVGKPCHDVCVSRCEGTAAPRLKGLRDPAQDSHRR